MINIDKQDGMPLYQQLYESVREAILTGEFKAGDHLPSIRSLMDDLDVSRNTIINAYRQICAEGFATGHQGAGYTVADISTDVLQGTSSADSACNTRRISLTNNPTERTFEYDFYYGDLLKESFPTKEWYRLISDVLFSSDIVSMTSYNCELGEIGLRSEIADYLKRSRGVRCNPDQVVLTSGTQQSIDRILALFNPKDHIFGMEDPGYDGARIVVENAGFTICPLCTHAGTSAFLHDVESSGAKLVYMTPSHQMPLGSLMDIGTRTEVIRLAADNDMYILEDDYDSEFRFNTRPIPALQSIDSWERVVYLGTFSKILSPALRLSYMVLPPKLLDVYKARYEKHYSTIPWLQQEALRRFMESGSWDKHVRRTVRNVRMRHNALMESISRELGDGVQTIGDKAGLHLLLKVKNGTNQEQLVASAAERGVRVCPTRHYWMNPVASPDDTVLLGYSNASVSDIESGISALSRAWF